MPQLKLNCFSSFQSCWHVHNQPFCFSGGVASSSIESFASPSWHPRTVDTCWGPQPQHWLGINQIYISHIYIYVYLNVYIYIHICTSLTGTSLESNQVLLFQPLTLFLVFGTLNLHKGVVAIGAAYPSSNHFKHMKLQMFPFQFHQKKSTNMKPRSENMDVQLASLQCSGSINPRAATKLRELSRGGSFNPRDIQECRKKGGQSRQSPFWSCSFICNPLVQQKTDGTLTVQVQSILSFVFCLLTMVS